MLDLTTIMLIVAALVILLFLLIEFILKKIGSKTIMQSEIVRLDADKSYTILFRKHMFSPITAFTIKARQEHLNLATKNTYYNGKMEVYIQISTAGITVYSAYLKNVLDFFVEEELQE